MRMSVLLLDVAAFNERARRVYEKCGFQPRGRRWGDPQLDHAGIFRLSERRDLRPLFHWEHGLVRPLLIDMILRKDEWERKRDERARNADLAPAPQDIRVAARRPA
jgi:RimJ/RimL family protein N-acetyltransferase